MNERKLYDVAIVGAGAAGLMSAISAGRAAETKRSRLNVVLFDTRQKIGAKILMSGGTRCNVTNREVTISDFHGGPSHFVKHVFDAFDLEETLHFFKGIGVDLALESSGKYFPVTHSAQTVLDALMREMRQVETRLMSGVRIKEVGKQEDLFCLKGDEGALFLAKKVILTTGGLSYPNTGSDGIGYQIAKSFGHEIVPTFPALTPLLTPEKDWKTLSGISFDVKLSLFKNGSKAAEYQDAFLFTHFGFSGPAALDISRYFASAKKEENPRIFISFLPDFSEESLGSALKAIREKAPKNLIKNILAKRFSLPERFIEVFINKIGIRSQKTIGQMSHECHRKLVHSLLHYPLEVTGVFGYKKAEVTAGGVDLKCVNFSTMESKVIDGLYFAGEILDVDGRIGGFNFQWAWSTGAVAGRSAARSLMT